MSERFEVEGSGGGRLVGTRWRRHGRATVVLLHAGVADRRAWTDVAERLADDGLEVVAYDRRGYGESPWAADMTFSELADLDAVLDRVGPGPVWVVGNSRGGTLALDAAVARAERVAGVVLVAGVPSGWQRGDEEPAEVAREAPVDALDARMSEARAAGDLDELARLQTHLWLDGPMQPEGRVSGSARELATGMARTALGWGMPEDAGATGVAAWPQLGGLTMPVVAAWGDLDVPEELAWYELTAKRIPGARVVVLRGCAHLPSLERPDLVTQLIRDGIRAG